MNVIETARARLEGFARAQENQYAGDADRPIAGYMGTMAVYAGVVGALAAGVKVTGREVPDGLPLTDIGLSALATHKLSRLLARDPVTSPLRVPFTAYAGTGGPAEVEEEVRGSGARKTVGELVTCPFCTGLWVATAFTAGLVYLPRTTRLTIGTFAALGGADLLQFAHAWLDKQTS
ncbi:MAG: DUF1360 domain-containing protein [Nocardiopsaceae bacterium]|nr:DUF1360 domain-containing protein [Nocardiopsaceae bacterium]